MSLKFLYLIVSVFLFPALAIAKEYPEPPPPTSADEAYVYLSGIISLNGGLKHYSRIIAVEHDLSNTRAGWTADLTKFYPNRSVRLDRPAKGKTATCGDLSIASRGLVFVLYAPIRNESTGRTIRCQLSGRIRMTRDPVSPAAQ